MLKKILSSVLIICVFLTVFIYPLSTSVSAISYPAYGVIENAYNKGYASLYSCAGTTGHETEDKKNTSVFLTKLYDGASVKLLSSEKDGDGDTWYKCRYGDGYAKEGYVYSPHVKMVGFYTYDEEFENWLTTQGFPESYKSGLRDIHSLCPEWVFYADHTGLEWSDVIDNESVLGKKLVSGNSDDSWKSLEEGAIDPSTGTWRVLDSGGYVAASRSVIEYYLDPRNFFDISSVCMFAKQSYNSQTDTLPAVENMVKGTFLDSVLPDDPLKTYAQVIFSALVNAGVSPCAVVSTIIQEQGTNGQGRSICGTYPGYEGLYNFFNIGAYADKKFSSAVERGLWYAKGTDSGATTYDRPWTTREKSIVGGAEWYAAGYINAGQDTFYFKNNNVSSYAEREKYTHQYATNISDSASNGKIYSASILELEGAAVAFVIPVFENMPEQTRLPNAGESNDNFLSDLRVDGVTVSEFSKYCTEYSLTVENTVEKIIISASLNHTASSLSGGGEYSLKEGENTIVLSVTSQTGQVRKYVLNVTRKSDPMPDIPKQDVDVVLRFKVGSAVSEALETVNDEGEKYLVTLSGEPKTSGTLASGDVVVVRKDGAIKKYLVAVIGDINGDGAVNAVDRTVISRYLAGWGGYENKIFTAAADIDNNGVITASDRTVLARYLAGWKSNNEYF